MIIPTVLFIFIHTDFTDFICKAPVLTIRVISVIRGFLLTLHFVPQISQIITTKY